MTKFAKKCLTGATLAPATAAATATATAPPQELSSFLFSKVTMATRTAAVVTVALGESFIGKATGDALELVNPTERKRTTAGKEGLIGNHND